LSFRKHRSSVESTANCLHGNHRYVAYRLNASVKNEPVSYFGEKCSDAENVWCSASLLQTGPRDVSWLASSDRANPVAYTVAVLGIVGAVV